MEVVINYLAPNYNKFRNQNNLMKKRIINENEVVVFSKVLNSRDFNV